MESKESTELVSTKDNYMHTFSLNYKWIITYKKTSATAAREFAQVFHMALYDVLEQKLEINHEGDLLTKVKFIVNTKDQLDKLKNFCTKITHEIPDMIVSFNFKGKIYDERKKIQEKIEKFYLFHILDEKLGDKPNKVSKVKI